MIPSLLAQAAEAGLRIALSPQGTIDITGEEDVVACWLPKLREHKGGILATLQDESQPKFGGEPQYPVVPPTYRQTHCPAYPKTGILAGASWEWCQGSRGKMDACSTCLWGHGLVPSTYSIPQKP